MSEAEKWSQSITKVTLGGNNTKIIEIGGDRSLPFHIFETEFQYRPQVAQEIVFPLPSDLPWWLKEPFKDVISSPEKWALKAIKEYGADLICLYIDEKSQKEDLSLEQIGDIACRIIETTKLPLIIYVDSTLERTNEILSTCAQLLKNKGCIIGPVTGENYKTIVASAIAYGHIVSAQSPIDINLAKQLNILIMDMGLKEDKILMDPLTAGLGYGIEYTYSVMERLRLQALSGDPKVAMPMICFIGSEAIRAREVKREDSKWGDEKRRGILWETLSATSLLLAGANIITVRHPTSINTIKKFIELISS